MLTTQSRRGRTAKACAQCRTAKTRCNFADGAASCDKCLQRGIECTLIQKFSSSDATELNSLGSKASKSEDLPAANRETPQLPPQLKGDPLSADHSLPIYKKKKNGNKLKQSRTPLTFSRHNEQSPKVHLLSPTDLANSALTNPLDFNDLRHKDDDKDILDIDSYEVSIHMRSPSSHHSNEGLSPIFTDESTSENSPGQNNTTSQNMNNPNLLEDRVRDLTGSSSQYIFSEHSSHDKELDNGKAITGPVYYSDSKNSMFHNEPNNTTTDLLNDPSNSSFLLSLDIPRTRHLSFENIHTKAPLSEHSSKHVRTMSAVDLTRDNTKDLFASLLGEQTSQSQNYGNNDDALQYLNDQQIDTDIFMNMNMLPNLENGITSQNDLQSNDRGEQTKATSKNLDIGSSVDVTESHVVDHAVISAGEHMQSSTISPPIDSHKFQTSVVHMALQAVGPILQERMGSISRMLKTPRQHRIQNVISSRILTHCQVVKLFGLFKGNYDHWISLPDAEPFFLVDYLLTQCPLLVTACCCVALRFGSADLWVTVYPRLVRYLNQELSRYVNNMPHNIESLQAITILAKYADTLSFEDCVFDMWQISGMGLQHFESVVSLQNETSYLQMRLWNHLAVTHITSSNITGRNVIIGDLGVRRCNNILEQSRCSQFDKCVLAEIIIQWDLTLYLTQQITFKQFEEYAKNWESEWGGLSNLSMIQFVRPFLLFCRFLARTTHFQRLQVGDNFETETSTNPFDIANTQNMCTEDIVSGLDSLIDIMDQLLTTVQPVYFVCLSDSIHNIGFLAGVMSMVCSKILMKREPTSPPLQKRVSYSQQLVIQMASRFRDTSRGQDVAQTQHISLIHLTKEREIQMCASNVRSKTLGTA